MTHLINLFRKPDGSLAGAHHFDSEEECVLYTLAGAIQQAYRCTQNHNAMYEHTARVGISTKGAKPEYIDLSEDIEIYHCWSQLKDAGDEMECICGMHCLEEGSWVIAV